MLCLRTISPLISGFHRGVSEIFALLGEENRFILEDGTDTLSRNVGNCQSTLRTFPDREKTSFTFELLLSWWRESGSWMSCGRFDFSQRRCRMRTAEMRASCRLLSLPVYTASICLLRPSAQLVTSLFCIPQKITLTAALPYTISGHWVSRGYDLYSFKVCFGWGFAAVYG